MLSDADYKLKSAAQTPATLHLSSGGSSGDGGGACVGGVVSGSGAGSSGIGECSAMIVGGAGDDHRIVYLNKVSSTIFVELPISVFIGVYEL